MKVLYFLIVFTFAVVAFYSITRKNQMSAAQQVNLGTKVLKANDIDTLVNLSDSLFEIKSDTLLPKIMHGHVLPDDLVSYAETLIGTPYKYASVDPSEGFDCSGFITYVFNHFNIKVPRSSKDFENVGSEISILKSEKGDLVLFTGTDSTERIIGHMGIIISNDNNSIKFIHSTSGKAHGVVISGFNDYYRGRFVKVVRIFN